MQIGASRAIVAVMTSAFLECGQRNMATEKENPYLTLVWEDPLSGRTLERTSSLPLSIGRDPTNLIVISSSSVSRHHARIELVDGKVTITDLQSSNGTFVNGERVESAPLADGDRLELGEVTVAIKFSAGRRTTRPSISSLFDAVEKGGQETTITLSSLKGKPLFVDLPPTTAHSPLKETQETPKPPEGQAKLTGDELKEFLGKRLQKDIDKDISSDIDHVAANLGNQGQEEKASSASGQTTPTEDKPKKGFFRRLFGS